MVIVQGVSYRHISSGAERVRMFDGLYLSTSSVLIYKEPWMLSPLSLRHGYWLHDLWRHDFPLNVFLLPV